MIINSLNRVLLNLRSNLSALLLLGCFGLASAPTADAQLTFTVDTFTNDNLSITLTSGSTLSLLGNPIPASFPNRLYIFSADGVNNSWIDDTLPSNLTDPSGYALLNVGVTAITAFTGETADGLTFTTAGFADLVAGSTVSASGNTAFTIGQAGLFDTSEISNFALYWGLPGSGGILQSTGVAATGMTSVAAVPEPNTYAAILGILALSGVCLRRRTRLAQRN